VLALPLALPAWAEDTDPAAQKVLDCMERNLSAKSSGQFVEFVAVDRTGTEQSSRAKIYGKRLDDGFRRMKLRFSKPPYMRDSEFLVIETDRKPDAFLYTPDLRRSKRITGRGSGGGLFGTDFSAEDLERWQGFNRPGKTKREPDAEFEGRPVHVLSTYPEDEANSSYQKVTMFVDKETCVVLKTESYETETSLRKVLTANPRTLLREAGIWVATDLVMKDLRDETQTRVTVEDLEIAREIPDDLFMVGRMGRRSD
jgi:outer membrane lipoprotein-sorting protein